MKCEYCGRILRDGDRIHGIRYGTLTSTGFKAAQDSAVVVICEPCGNKVHQYVYASLDNRALAYPAIFKMVTDLTSFIKNGYKLIQNIAKLPAPDQRHFTTSLHPARNPSSSSLQSKPSLIPLVEPSLLPVPSNKVPSDRKYGSRLAVVASH